MRGTPRRSSSLFSSPHSPLPSSLPLHVHSPVAIFQSHMNVRPLYGVSLNPLSPQVKIQKDTMTDRLSLAATTQSNATNNARWWSKKIDALKAQLPREASGGRRVAAGVSLDEAHVRPGAWPRRGSLTPRCVAPTRPTHGPIRGLDVALAQPGVWPRCGPRTTRHKVSTRGSGCDLLFLLYASLEGAAGRRAAAASTSERQKQCVE